MKLDENLVKKRLEALKEELEILSESAAENREPIKLDHCLPKRPLALPAELIETVDKLSVMSLHDFQPASSVLTDLKKNDRAEEDEGVEKARQAQDDESRIANRAEQASYNKEFWDKPEVSRLVHD